MKYFFLWSTFIYQTDTWYCCSCYYEVYVYIKRWELNSRIHRNFYINIDFRRYHLAMFESLHFLFNVISVWNYPFLSAPDSVFIDFLSCVFCCVQTYAEPYNEEAISQYHKIDEYIDDMRLVEAYYRGHDHRACVELASRLLDTSPWAAHLRQLRAECYIALVTYFIILSTIWLSKLHFTWQSSNLSVSRQNDLFSAVSDIRSVNRLQQDSTDGYYRLATLLYRLGHVSDALKVTHTFSARKLKGGVAIKHYL